MTLLDEAAERMVVRSHELGAERQLLTAAGWVDRPSSREALNDDPYAAKRLEESIGSGVRVGGWQLTHAAARRWADLNGEA